MKEVKGVFIYTEGNRTAKMKKEANLSPAEVRLFFYFLLKKRTNLNDKKAEEFQGYLDKGELPGEMGIITKGKRCAFCIKKVYKKSYTLYVSVNEEPSFHTRIRRILAKVKK